MHPQKQGEMDETYPYEEKYFNGPQLGQKQKTMNSKQNSYHLIFQFEARNLVRTDVSFTVFSK